ncbi:S1/P1 nuclease [Pseudotenacibaculum haliotis]|uniref:S1/P1 nuclease n=1 Tax=Pseudotenacibaculum haliotis TaxID=1862138 RepID=A0ABW5LNB3_9FLAO
MKFRILSLFLFVSLFVFANDNDLYWGQTGHRVVGEIASQNLSKRAKKNLEKLLGKEGLAILSTYADEIKSDRKYDKFKPWHYVNFKDGETYETSKKNPKGDLIQGIKKCKEVIQDPNASKEDKVFYLKLLVHLIGDLHQPLHIGRAEDRGGNAIKVQWFRRNTNLHSVWDSKMLDQFDMSYSELSSNLNTLSKKQVKAIQQGSVLDWVKETRVLTMKIYDSAKADENLSYRYMYDHFDTVKSQLQKGGLRLAKVLNELFG